MKTFFSQCAGRAVVARSLSIDRTVTLVPYRAQRMGAESPTGCWALTGQRHPSSSRKRSRNLHDCQIDMTVCPQHVVPYGPDTRPAPLIPPKLAVHRRAVVGFRCAPRPGVKKCTGTRRPARSGLALPLVGSCKSRSREFRDFRSR